MASIGYTNKETKFYSPACTYASNVLASLGCLLVTSSYYEERHFSIAVKTPKHVSVYSGNAYSELTAYISNTIG